MKGGHLAAHAVKHAADLAVTTFVKRYPSRRGGEDLEFGRQRGDVLGFEIKTRPELIGSIGRDGVGGGDVVDFSNFMVRMHQGLGPASVIGEQDKPGRVDIKTAHEMQGGFVGIVDEVDDGAVAFVPGRTDDSHGFVQHDAQAPRRELHDLVVEGYLSEAINILVEAGRGEIIEHRRVQGR